MPGAGKTTVGGALAQLMQWRFVDVDALVANTVGDVAAFIDANGIDEFRAHESAAIRSLHGAQDLVISVGGGAVLDPLNRAVLDETGVVVWLRATLDTLKRNVGDGAGRPLLAEGPETALRKLLAEREPVYEQVADVVIDVDGFDPNETAVEIVRAVCE